MAAVAGGKIGNVGECIVDKAAAAAIESIGGLDIAFRVSAGSGSKVAGSAETTTEGVGPLGLAGIGILGSGEMGKVFCKGDPGIALLVVGVVGDDEVTGGADTGTERVPDKTLGTNVEDIGEMLPVEAERPLAGMDTGESAPGEGTGDASGMGCVVDILDAVGTGRDGLSENSFPAGDIIENGGFCSVDD